MAARAPVQLSVLVVGDDPSPVEAAFGPDRRDPVAVTVDSVADVNAAVAAVERDPPDCLVLASGAVPTDIDGAIERLEAAGPDRPIVVLAADASAVESGFDAGATECLLASVAEARPEILASRLRSAVDRTGPTGLPNSPGWYDAILEHSMDALTVLAGDGTIVYQNPSVERLLGYEPEALVGTNAVHQVHPDDREGIRRMFQRLYAAGDGECEQTEFRFRNADGSWEHVESVVTARRGPGIDGFVVNTRLVTERKQREREVERYETLLSVLPDTITITDLEGKHVDIYGFEGWSGYDTEELLGEAVAMTMPEEDIERAEELVRELIVDDDREKAIFETHIETKDGELVPFENHMTALPPDDDGMIPGTMNVLRDLSERKERERELQQAETVFQNVRDGVFLADVTADGRFVYQRTNAAYEEITGFAEDDVRGRTPHEFIPHEEIATHAEDVMVEAVETRSPIHDEHVVEHPELPTHLEVWVAPVIVDDEVDGVVGVVRDITDRKERERELRLKNQAMDEAPVAISIVEPDGTDVPIVYVNDGFQQLTGYDESEAIGEDWRILGGKETSQETIETFQGAITNGEPISTEMVYYSKDGTPSWAQASVTPILNEDGELTHFAGFHQDITDLKEYETEIERRFDEFAEVLAEDLRQPLEAAREAVEAARVEGDEDALAEAATSLERTDSLLADLATVHAFSVPSRDHSESALLGQHEGA